MARKLDPSIDRAIHEATLELLAARGLGGLTMEAVASRAGVARTTVYRRHDDVDGLVEAAVDSILSLPPPAPSVEGRDAWRHVVLSLHRALFHSDVGLPLLAALIVAEEENPALLRMWRERVVEPRIKMISGEFGWAPEVASRMGQLALGGLIGGYLAERIPDEDAAKRVADLLWYLASLLEGSP